MLVYGGLLPSRLHQHSVEVLSDRLQRLVQLKVDYPHLQILASNLIMRTPAYNSSEEEPDYYATHGEAICRWGSLSDRRSRHALTSEEETEFACLNIALPAQCLDDYRCRRAKNLAINQSTIKLVNSGVITFLSIPQDDCAPYGFTAQDQQVINQQICELRLQQNAHLYPGADEVGCTLLARAWCSRSGPSSGQFPSQPPSQLPLRVHLLYSSVMGDRIIPRYEDRPIGESLKAHLWAAGATLAHSLEAADLVLAVNTPGQVMQEAWDQTSKDITYNSFRNLRVFVNQIRQLLDQDIPVALADIAFSNGGETELVQLLDDLDCWDRMLSYAAWNTSCNSLGTAIATAILGLDSTETTVLNFNKIYHVLEDWAYQSIVRRAITEQYLPEIGASSYDFNGQTEAINHAMASAIKTLWEQVIRRSFQSCTLEQLKVYSPWQRMFEIGLDLTLTAR
ncbi:MAG: DUF4127 family protein [Synechococcales cyanobacterium RU_4_20]|nr:DUF4127 family protein [Synechococcales cyanobacterium RU_4_20]